MVSPLTGLCGEDGIRCPEGTCLSAGERCDGQVHCSDGSDEPITCGRFETVYSDVYLSPNNELQRSAPGAHTPVMLSRVSPPAGRICSMNNGGCSHVCVDEAWGALCACPAGYKLSANGAVCEGVWNENNTLISVIEG